MSPTGYTADVESGKLTDFRTFALRCARAFGACVMQRDDPMGDPPKPREPSPYYANQLAKAKTELVRLSEMTDEQAKLAAERDYQRQLTAYRDAVERNRVENGRYAAMLEQVRAWMPPTSEHEGLKTFMVQQLTDSMRDYLPPEPTRSTAAAWLENARAQAEKDVAYYEKHVAEDEERARGATEWISQLYESLGEVVV